MSDTFFLFLSLLFIFLTSVYAVSSRKVLEWNQTTEHWEEFHIRYCGRVCVNGSLQLLSRHVTACLSPRCFQCDCHQTCSLLDTCCPHGTIQPDGSFQRQQNKLVRTNPLPHYPYQVQCASIPYNERGYFLQVLDCPQDETILSMDLTEGERNNLKEMCVQNYTEETDLDYILPYVDAESGLVFRNKFCSLCNGYSVKSMDEIVRTNSVKMAVPWNLKIKCSHYQNLFHLTSPKTLIEKAVKPVCKVYYEKADAKRQPRSCFSSSSQSHDSVFTCEDPLRSLCLELNNTYLSLSSHRNIFCFMCADLKPVHRTCFADFPHIPQPEPNIGIAPLSLLLGVAGRRTPTAYQRWHNCSSVELWFNENVSLKDRMLFKSTLN